MDTRIRYAFEQGNGILRLAPTWVPRKALIPGKRIKLHPDDYYALGGEKGGISERWLSSTTSADNGPLTGKDEGQSKVVFDDGQHIHEILLRDVVNELKDELIGIRIWNNYKSWPMYSKFFDCKTSLSFHVHYNDTFAGLIGQEGKPEAYYFPVQLNSYAGEFPFSFLGFRPGTTKNEIIACLKNFGKGDNHITGYSQAYGLELGTSWDIPAGILHAPGSLCTYEPQKSSDVFAKYQSLVNNMAVPESMFWKDTPEEKKGDYDYLIDALDWDLNTDPGFMKNRFMKPVPVCPQEEMDAKGYDEKWICYKSDAFSAKELTVLPGVTVVVEDKGAYGMIMLQGHGEMGVWEVESPTLIRFGQVTSDEFFISEQAARSGVRITNHSQTEPLVMLKHFGPGNPDRLKDIFYEENLLNHQKC
jgi:hypothetical protein